MRLITSYKAGAIPAPATNKEGTAEWSANGLENRGVLIASGFDSSVRLQH